ncbi:AGC protein kinase Ppk18 [Schizosaccharomyces japonicus yFS275]|uniref:non-specific serine/threonine protein kinase n=1 Tax=Schizosaccharomyces japonicus (strain yFS275 / FY16936) TaxID=402676 RepID=B6JV54_SCHJY|nr:AGC protein kinase Ppk18 [Schizosaccharomyces japonicus yFS275]EEB05255.1 AGC protein kinase Ppk18 [Schizosaccharomyces japonicus yFS275]
MELAVSKDPVELSDIGGEVFVLELSLNCEINYVSANLLQVVGRSLDNLVGKPVASLVTDDEVFHESTTSLMEDDSRSAKVETFLSILPPEDDVFLRDEDMAQQPVSKGIEGTGILIKNPATGESTHTLWVFKEAKGDDEVRDVITTQLSATLGFGAKLLVDYLNQVRASASGNVPEELFLCRVCDQKVPNWLFEKHTELCLLVHQVEARVLSMNDELVDHRNLLVAMCEELEDDPNKLSIAYNDTVLQALPAPSTAVAPSHGRPSHGHSRYGNSNDHKRRAHEFLLRMVMRALELTDLGLSIHTSSANTSMTCRTINDFRALSPTSEMATSEALSWCTPQVSDEGLRLLFRETMELVQRKIKENNRLSNILYYFTRLCSELQDQVRAFVERMCHVGNDTPSSALSPIASALDFNQSEFRGPRDSVPTSSLNLESDSAFKKTNVSEANPTCPGASMLSSVIKTQTSPPPLTSFHDLPNPMNNMNMTVPPPDKCVSTAATSSPIMAAVQPSSYSRRQSISSVNMMYGVVSSSYTMDSSPIHKRSPSLSGNSLMRNTSDSSPVPAISMPVMGSKTTASIKDFELIKPISKGAFGSVYLAKKRATGEIYAIKVLKKGDMIAKNQVTNVRSERAILMAQEQSPFIAQLYYAFQSKHYLYLVMEFMNGGDLAALLKSFGALPVSWVKTYSSEIILALKHLHELGIIHRDIKPDNILMTTRQYRLQKQRENDDSGDTSSQGTLTTPRPSYPNSPILGATLSAHQSRSSSPLTREFRHALLNASEGGSIGTEFIEPLSLSAGTSGHASFQEASDSGDSLMHVPLSKGKRHRHQPSWSFFRQPDAPKHFVGTPDYLAPETIQGSSQDDMVDWWAVGCVIFECLFGYPPFHADSPEKIFKNIVSHSILWPDRDDFEYGPEIYDLLNRFLDPNPETRLGAKGVDEIQAHPFFSDIDWDHVSEQAAPFVPITEDSYDTVYFDSRGASFEEKSISSLVNDDAATFISPKTDTSRSYRSTPTSARRMSSSRSRRSSHTTGMDEFGSFSYKNLSVLEQANRDAVERIRLEFQQKTGSAPSTPDSLSDKASVPDKLSVSNPPKFAKKFNMLNALSTEVSCAISENSSPISPLSSNLALKRNQNRHFSDSEAVAHGLSKVSIGSETPEQGSPKLKSETGRPSSSHIPTISLRNEWNRRSATNLHFLVCEDSSNTYSDLVTYLRSNFATVTVVDNPNRFLFYLMSNTKFSIIFIQLYLPRVSGISLIKLLRTSTFVNRNTPTVALFSSRVDLGTTLPPVFDGRLYIPINYSRLNDYISRFCNFSPISEMEF